MSEPIIPMPPLERGAAAMETTPEQWAASVALPIHYRDNGELCDYSGTIHANGCPRGCDGARYHYTNDGHPQCAEEES